MNNDSRKIKNPEYLWASRVAFWIVVLFVIPLFIWRIYSKELTLGDFLTLIVYGYAAAGNYVLGYRLNNPPVWANWIIPTTWMSEWRFLISGDTESLKTNKRRLIRFSGGAGLAFFLLLAFLSGKL